MEKFIISNGCALRLNDSAKGDNVVVLLHGYLESLDVFDEFAKLLKPHARVVTMDLPGHGISEVKGEKHSMEFLAESVVGVLDNLDVEKATIVGHSLGGYVALAMAELHPERLEGIVLLHSSPNPDSEAKLKDREREINLVKGGKKDLFALTAPSAGFAQDHLDKFKEEVEFLTEQIYITEDLGIIAILRGMSERKDQNEMLRNSPIKQLFIFGRKDSYIPTEVAEELAQSHPQAKVVWLDNSGHLGFFEQPKECAQAIVDFIK